ncbi:MAG: TetR/AcrR family transcriptional regulator [Actinomycetia bacterium]|nr:TetR/AcrR family transcriptional regulator [Actinomycetes bacterium]
MARPLSEEARMRALDAAAALLAESGLEGYTVDAVARRSGVAKTTIYRHWDSSNALLIDALDCQIQAFPTPNTGSLLEDLRTFLSVVLQVVDDGMRPLMLGVIQAAATDPDLARIHEQMTHERMQPLRTIVQLAQARGEIHTDIDLDLAVSFIEGPVFVKTIIHGAGPDPDQLGTLLALTVAGLTAWEPS